MDLVEKRALGIALMLTLAGCGSSGGSSGSSFVPNASTAGQTATPQTAQTQQPPPPPPGPGAPPPPPPPGGGGTAPTIDADLQTRLANANITTPVKRAPESQALVDLGRDLFFDKVLSGNKNVSCATCHSANAGTGDGLPLSLGEGATGAAPNRQPTDSSQIVARNALSLFNVPAQNANVLFWDGRVRIDRTTNALVTPDATLNGPTPQDPAIADELTTPLAAQSLFPLVTPEEMLGHAGDPGNELAGLPDNTHIWGAIMVRLVGTANGATGGIDAYKGLFRAAYPSVTNLDDLTIGHAGRAIAAFESSTFGFFDAPLDQYLAGNMQALSQDAKLGGILFAGAARCTRCHRGPILSDERPHGTAVPQLGPGKNGENDDRGVALVSGNLADNYKFRTSPLRNVGLTGPFTHDGAFGTLEGVLRHYSNPAGALLNYDASHLPVYLQSTVDRDPSRNNARLAAVDPAIGTGIPMSDTDIQQIVAFLQSLTDPAAQNLPPAPASVPSGLPVGD